MLFEKLLLQSAHADWLVRVDCVNRVVRIAHVGRAGRLSWQAGVQWGVLARPKRDLEEVLERGKSLIQVPGSGCRNWQDGQNGDKTLRRHSFQVTGAMGFVRDIEYKASSAFIYTQRGPATMG